MQGGPRTRVQWTWVEKGRGFILLQEKGGGPGPPGMGGESACGIVHRLVMSGGHLKGVGCLQGGNGG